MGLIGHQWRKHGTCSGLSQRDYFAVTRAAHERLTIPPELTTADGAESLSVQAIEAAFEKKNSGMTSESSLLPAKAGYSKKSGLLRQGTEIQGLSSSRPTGLQTRHRLAASSTMMERHRMKILYSPASPYSNKVRMAAHHAGIAAESVLTETNSNPPQLIDNNPLGKIPTLITADGLAIYDSRAIMHFIDRETGGKLYPKNHEKRTRIEIFEALCDGICDSLLAIVYEKRFHPPEKVHQPWIDRQWDKVERGLDHLEANLPKTGSKLNAGHFALAATLRYIELRFAGEGRRAGPSSRTGLPNSKSTSRIIRSSRLELLRVPLIPLPQPSPRRRGEGTRSPALPRIQRRKRPGACRLSPSPRLRGEGAGRRMRGT